MKFYVEIDVPDADLSGDVAQDQSDIATELGLLHPYLSDVTVWTLDNLVADITDGVLTPVERLSALPRRNEEG